ncbi:hypothetical protein B0T22DRAFT_264831 [Podospora appendiculata]|uniref:Uncharacterized protein n=1 Tax=Podospora appendiculata TaxID=314037 RepID=A0AAE1C993_9PEZI|nr:hypothetical protein B0T22DRAFT_264831 [Podospora appendiculata]
MTILHASSVCTAYVFGAVCNIAHEKLHCTHHALRTSHIRANATTPNPGDGLLDLAPGMSRDVRVPADQLFGLGDEGSLCGGPSSKPLDRFIEEIRPIWPIRPDQEGRCRVDGCT